ncbi:MAG: hypothetical protein JJU28_03835 [Cyclobacteriaceae bacterium]|nr:hypothetical protein [Cyclobacteriaceae bacterium]
MRKILSGILFSMVCLPALSLEIVEETYLGVPHFVIKTRSATYFYDKFGGGFSSIIDRDGKDWVDFKRDPWDTFPGSAASSYRGLPKFVYTKEDSGAGHPGRKKCVSILLNKRSIKTIAMTGNWEWTWVFYENHATVTMDRVDPENRYSFMYHGPIAGSFVPEKKYWGTNLGGPRFDINDFHKNDMIYANWWWIYFGDIETRRILFIAMEKPDIFLDTFSYMGDSEKGIASDDGMVVFSFGRMQDSQPLLKDSGKTFYIGFVERKIENSRQHSRMKTRIEKIIH